MSEQDFLALDFRDLEVSFDLSRRDFTINAMARDDTGRLIDPCGGARDLERRVLRHVSPAFREDPLRVLRVARFAARFAGLGFRVHPDTLALMTGMAASGELAHLAPERVWAEIAGAMGEPTPSAFITVLRECGALAVLLPVVAGQSGNTGAQALAVTMRGLALREITIRHWFTVMFKEVRVGFLNGLAIATTCGAGHPP